VLLRAKEETLVVCEENPRTAGADDAKASAASESLMMSVYCFLLCIDAWSAITIVLSRSMDELLIDSSLVVSKSYNAEGSQFGFILFVEKYDSVWRQ